MKTLVLALALLLSGLPGRAAWAQLRVYVYWVSGGEAYYQERGGRHLLHPNEELPAGRALVLAPHCQLVLWNKRGQTAHFEQAGPLTYQAIQDAFAAVAPSLTSAYMAWAFKRVGTPPPPPGDELVTGVVRGEQLRLVAPADSAVLAEPEVAFRWVAEGDGPFLFTLTDGTGRPVLQLRTPAAALGLSLRQSQLQANTVYYWSVVPTAEPVSNAPRRALLWPDAALLSRLRPLLPAEEPRDETEQQGRARYRARWLYRQASAGGE